MRAMDNKSPAKGKPSSVDKGMAVEELAARASVEPNGRKRAALMQAKIALFF